MKTADEGGENLRLLERAFAHHQEGRLHEAEQLYREILNNNHKDPKALYLLGTLKAQSNQNTEALNYLREATRQDPANAKAWLNQGNVLLLLDSRDDARECFYKALAIDRDLAAAYSGLGHIQLLQRRYSESRSYFEQALDLNPHLVQARTQLGISLRQLGELTAAEDCFNQAIKYNPENIHIVSELAIVQVRLGKHEDAVAGYRKILQLRPDAADTWSNLGTALRSLARLDEAADSYRRALFINPNLVEAWNNLGNVLKTIGRPDEAINCYRQVLKLRPVFAQAYSNLLLCMNYLPDCDERSLYQEHLRWAETQLQPPCSLGGCKNIPDKERRLRVGYVSPDLRAHAVAAIFEPLLANHNHEEFEVICYAQVARGDEITRRLQSQSDGWCRTAGMTDKELAEKIYNDGIDILVDLAGHTGRNRLQVFAMRPAPIQISWLGYPNTTGLSAINYRLTDKIADPAGAEKLYMEELVRLKGGLTRYMPPENESEPGALPALMGGGITFGSLNNLVKINDEVISLWSRVLQAIPGSRLLLYRDMLHGSVAERVRSCFSRHGISGARLELRCERAAGVSHLSVYEDIDIALDPFPWNGHITTCEALWMGVPVVTLQGAVHRSRLSASVLHQAGLEKLVAGNTDEYIEIAGDLAADLERLSRLRANLRQRMETSVLCDGASFASEVEAVYRDIWRKWCAMDIPFGRDLTNSYEE